jgi:hypothetical protein
MWNHSVQCYILTAFPFFQLPIFQLTAPKNYVVNFLHPSYISSLLFCFSWFDSRSGPRPPPYRGITITLRHTTLGRTPLDEWSVLRRDLYLATHNTHKRQTSMPPGGFEPIIPTSERPQNHALDRTAAAVGRLLYLAAVITPDELYTRDNSEFVKLQCNRQQYNRTVALWS